jgi:hypothetical protein
MKNLLRFGKPNAKLKALENSEFNLEPKKVITFSLPSGYTCPGAEECLSYANRKTGKIKDGKHTKFRCFQASAEAIYPSLRNMVWNNFDALRNAAKAAGDGRETWALANLILQSLQKEKFDICRVHVGGDFFSEEYFNAWILVAERLPDKLFYAYTKSLKTWRDFRGYVPSNLVLTASRGGKNDELINNHNFKCAEVVFSEEEAIEKGLEIDHDDSHAAYGDESFALLIHGTQPKGSKASKALQKLRKKGIGGYSNKRKAVA